MSRRRYGLVGTGMRARMYADACIGPHADVAELVALCDVNEGRLRFHAERMRAAGAREPVLYHPDDLERMLAEQNIDRLIVTSPDYTHADFVVRGLRAGADVVVEKPLTIDADGCRGIIEASEHTGKSARKSARKSVVVTFNYRYSPRNAALKELIASGEIGEVTSVHFEWVLDTVHGADYFRRWHRDKNNSGGLLVHKSSHHFDLVNWWIDDAPTRVFASGGLRFYGARNAAKRGLEPRPVRGSVDQAGSDPFALDLRKDAMLRTMYFDNEKFDGYLRDQDVFADGITIEDNLSLVVDYFGGASMSYSLNAHAPWEGYTVSVNGTRGRAELSVVERGAVRAKGHANNAVDPSASPDSAASNEIRPVSERLIMQRHWEDAREVPILQGEGAHGGGDARLLRDVFAGPDDDPLARPADYLDGVRAVAVGIAGNASLAGGQPVRIEDLSLGANLGKTVPRQPTANP